MDPKAKDSVPLLDPENIIFPSSEAMLAGQLAAGETEPPPLKKAERRRLKRQEEKNAQRRPTSNAGTAVAGRSQSPKQEEKSGRTIPSKEAETVEAGSSQAQRSPKKVVVKDNRPTSDAGATVVGSSQPKKKVVDVLNDDDIKELSTGGAGNEVFPLMPHLQAYQAYVVSLEDQENQATNDDTTASSSKKRKHVDGEYDVLHDPINSPSPKRPRLEPRYDELEIIDPESETQVFEEEDLENTRSPSPPPKKRKRVVDEDDLAEGELSAARPKKQHRGSIKTTIYCGVRSPALNDPPIQPKKGGYPAAGATVYLCPRCEVSLSRPDTVRTHFSKCIETNGNPDALRWTDFTERTRTPVEILAEAKAGTKKPASKKVSRAPTPAQNTAAPAATSSTPPPPPHSQSPAPVQEQKPSGPINLTNWANLGAPKRKRAAEEEEEELDPTEGRQEQKRQKRTPVAKAPVEKKAKIEPFDRFAEMKKVAAVAPGGHYPRTNPHPRFERPCEPWERPAPGMITEMDELFWQKQPGNTIPLATELAIQRGEIFSIQK